MSDFPKPPFDEPQQPIPGETEAMDVRPDHGEDSYKGSGRLEGKKALITAGLAQALADRGIRGNCVAPGPIWTPLIPSTMPKEKVDNFGNQVPMQRPGQPRELAPVYVMLASDEASYVSGATIAVTGGKPFV